MGNPTRSCIPQQMAVFLWANTEGFWCCALWMSVGGKHTAVCLHALGENWKEEGWFLRLLVFSKMKAADICSYPFINRWVSASENLSGKLNVIGPERPDDKSWRNTVRSGFSPLCSGFLSPEQTFGTAYRAWKTTMLQIIDQSLWNSDSSTFLECVGTVLAVSYFLKGLLHTKSKMLLS